MNAVCRDFYLRNSAKREEELYEVFGRLFGGLLHDMRDRIGDSSLEGDSFGAKASEIYSDQLARLERDVHFPIFAPSATECKTAASDTRQTTIPKPKEPTETRYVRPKFNDRASELESCQMRARRRDAAS